MRVKLKGVAKVKKTLADGTVRYYFYAWRGGPLLKHNGRPLQPNDPMFHVAYTEAHAARKERPKGDIASLVQVFRDSSEFAKLADKTKRDYRRYLDMIDEEFGGLPLGAIAQPKARGRFKQWRDSFSANPRKADYAWTVLARVFSVAKDRGLIPTNPCERGGRLYEADRADMVWSADQLKAIIGAASPEVAFAVLMALWTGQREGDLLKLTWSQYDGQFIRLKQSKTGKRVRIPVAESLRAKLDALIEEAKVSEQKVVGHILVSSRGTPWTEDGFRSSWAAAYERSGLPLDEGSRLRFHDLRGTAVTRLALAGCSTSEIASFTGHSLKNVEEILDAHYLGGRFELAEQALLKLETREAQKMIGEG